MRLTKLIKYSPQRDAIFHELKAQNDALTGNSTAGIRVLCPTRWNVHADALLSIKNNYKVLLSTWEDAVQITKDTESKARIQGVHAMGTDCAPQLANLFLFHYEYSYMKILMKNNLCVYS